MTLEAECTSESDNRLLDPLQESVTNQDNEKALWDEIRPRLRPNIDSLLSHYLHVAPAEELAHNQQLLAVQAALAADPVVQGALRTLRTISEEVRRGESSKEIPMYEPLGRIFAAISSITQSRRKFHKTANTEITPSTIFPVFPNRKPDFLLVDQAFDAAQEQIRWHLAYAIVEVKCRDEGPSRKGTMTQIADEARLHMIVHPFRLFSIVLVIHDNKFTIVVIDRGGVMYSKSMLVYDEAGLTLQFIIVIQQLCNGLDDRDLGLDPTAAKQNPPLPDAFPSYEINPRMKGVDRPAAPSPGRLVTRGPPVWSSMSLFGRGSVVWRASLRQVDDHLCVVKTAWRHQGRTPEFEIYRCLEMLKVVGQKGIASFVDGGDVLLGSQDAQGREQAITVNNLRPDDAQLSPGEDIALHRVILESVGKPLWEFKDERQFLCGILAAIRGIRTLEDMGIVHRDISAGNVLLSERDDRPGFEGFIADFEFAKLPPGSLSNTNQLSPGPNITGTVQFMAYDLLEVLENPKSEPVTHMTHHDLESLVYVIAYAAFRRVYKMAFEEPVQLDPAVQKPFLAEFRRIFGRLDARGIRDARVQLVNSPRIKSELLKENVFDHLHKRLVALLNILLAETEKQIPAKNWVASLDPEDVDFAAAVVGEDPLPAVPPTRVFLTCGKMEGILDRAIQRWKD